MGREITLSDIGEVPLRKAFERISACRSFVKSLSLSKRIIFVNDFIISLFYVALFYVLPTAIWRKIKSAISKLIIPFSGAREKYHTPRHLLMLDES